MASNKIFIFMSESPIHFIKQYIKSQEASINILKFVSLKKFLPNTNYFAKCSLSHHKFISMQFFILVKVFHAH